MPPSGSDAIALLQRADATMAAIEHGCAALRGELATFLKAGADPTQLSSGQGSGGGSAGAGSELALAATPAAEPEATRLHTDRRVFLSYSRGATTTPFARWCKARLEESGWSRVDGEFQVSQSVPLMSTVVTTT